MNPNQRRRHLRTRYRVMVARERRERDVASISSPETVVETCADMCTFDREHFDVLMLNTKNVLIKRENVSIGSLNATIVHPRELFKAAVSASAASVVVVHNHPSGDPTPSSADILLTRRLVNAGDVLGIDVLDHVVLGSPQDFVSMKEQGLM